MLNVFCHLCGQLNGKMKQNDVRWKAAHDKWVAQDNVIKSTIAHVCCDITSLINLTILLLQWINELLIMMQCGIIHLCVNHSNRTGQVVLREECVKRKCRVGSIYILPIYIIDIYRIYIRYFRSKIWIFLIFLIFSIFSVLFEFL